MKIPAGARAAGMGQAQSAIVGDVTALFWNPSGLMSIQRTQLFFSHHRWIQQVRQDYVAFAKRAKAAGWGLALQTSDYGKLELRGGQPARNPVGYFDARDLALIFGYARSLSPRLVGGASLKFIYEKIYTEEATGLAADFGLQFRPDPTLPLILSAVLQNIGKMSRLQNAAPSLPLRVVLGAGIFRWNLHSLGFLTIAGDLGIPAEGNMHLSLGAEWQPTGPLFFRAGYAKGPEARGIHAGAGVARGRIRVDYSFIPFSSDLGQANQVSLMIRF